MGLLWTLFVVVLSIAWELNFTMFISLLIVGYAVIGGYPSDNQYPCGNGGIYDD